MLDSLLVEKLAKQQTDFLWFLFTLFVLFILYKFISKLFED
jgi:hypothetical protein